MGLRSALVGQLGHPRGRPAPLVAAFMNRANAEQNHHAVKALEVEGHHDVLDAGFGGGVGLRLLLEHVTAGRVAGVETSDDMLSRAEGRFVDDVEAGRLELQAARLEDLPFEDDSFDRILSVNTYYFLEDPDRVFAEMHRVLRPGGRTVHAVRDAKVLRRIGFDPERQRLDEPERIAARARSAGFEPVTVGQPENDDRIQLVIADTQPGG